MTLELHGLTRSFGAVAAVDDVGFVVPGGQMVGVVGRSGAGKSTLLRMINGLTEPSAGHVLFGGREVSSLRGRALRDWRADCAMVFQQFNLVQRLDVLTNVLLGRLHRRRGPLAGLTSLLALFTAEERAAALGLLDRFGLADAALQRAETLSGGQQQRVAICRVLMQEPKVVLADEPISSLDPANAEAVMRALRGVNRAQGLTVLCNLHQLDAARAHCDRILGVRRGRVVFDGPPAALDAAREEAIFGGAEAAEGPAPSAFPGGALARR